MSDGKNELRESYQVMMDVFDEVTHNQVDADENELLLFAVLFMIGKELHQINTFLKSDKLSDDICMGVRHGVFGVGADHDSSLGHITDAISDISDKMPC